MASKGRVIKWYKAHQGIVSYSQEERQGPSSYDSASAMFEALIYAGYLPRGKWLGNISVLSKMEGTLLKAIDAKDKRRGDIFISRPKSEKTLSEGHTGVIIDRRRIILCCEEYDGIIILRTNTWADEQLRWFRLCYPVSPINDLKNWLQQWCPQYSKKSSLHATDNFSKTVEDSEALVDRS